MPDSPELKPAGNNSALTLAEELATLKIEEPQPKLSLNAKILEQQKNFERAKASQLEGQMNELKARVDGFDNSMQKVVEGVNGQALKIMEQIMALEQTVLSIGKITTAITQTLIQKKLTSDAEIMANLRLNEDQIEESRLQELVKVGMLKLAPLSAEDSILVVRQESLKDEVKQLVSNFRTVELRGMKSDDPLRAEFLGKTSGDVIVTSKDGETFMFTIKSIYELVDQRNLEPGA